MPSDPRIETVLEALAEPIARYRSAVATAVEEVRAYLVSHRADPDGARDEVAAEFGRFGHELIDMERVARLLSNSRAVDPTAVDRVEQAMEVLRSAIADDDEFRLDLEPGTRLGPAVAAALGRAGRVFGAARLVGLVKAKRFRPDRDGNLFGPLPFERWTEAERRYAPPLVVHLDGADLAAGDLAPFMDGGVKIVLVVRGGSPPAPLVRLITPGTLVIQTADETGLDRIGGFDGPAVAALVPEGAASFVHDPRAGTEAWERLQIASLPENRPAAAVGGLSVAQQIEELGQLVALTRGRETGAADAADDGPTDPVDRLAAWLLSQADLEHVG